MSIILGIESSCDETSIAIIKDGELLSNVVATQIEMHQKFGGVMPELASRLHCENALFVLDEALTKTNITLDQVDAFAFTRGPGLIGALHIGMQVAKTLAMLYNKPLIPVHHLAAHIYANEFVKPLQFPLLSIVVSGGSFSSFSLSSWDEQTSDSAKVSAEKYVSLSWAINIYGAAYYVTDTGDALADIADAFNDYNDDLFDEQDPLEDCFTYSEAGTNDPVGPTIPIITTTNGESGNNKELILFFTIEFSNDSDTFYSLGETYYTKDTSGDSNCYKDLRLEDLVFNIS